MLRITLFIALAICGLTFAASVDPKLAGDGGYLIWNGNCNNVTSTSLVSADHVKLNAIPLYKRDHTTEYHGDKVVTCVTVLSLKGTQHCGTAQITKGGYGHAFVTVYMESERGYGIEFQVNIYAQ